MMRTLNEALEEAAQITSFHLNAIQKLVELGKTMSEDEKEMIAKLVASIWHTLKPVHQWIRSQNPQGASFYDELDKYIEQYDKALSQVKSENEISTIEPKTKKSKK
jgi:DNA-directed RNA polymerase alpha subunit